jgi:RimJ/RimL family protein N-acetyltransferase
LIPKEDDFGNYLSWMRDSKTNSFIKSVRAETTLEDLHRYVEFHNDAQNSLLLGIFLKPNFKHIGNIKLEPIVHNQKATLGILIGEEEWRGKGIGFEVLTIVLDYCFKDLKLKTVELGVNKKNIAAIKLYSRIGFIENIEATDSNKSIKMSIQSYNFD